MIGHSKQRQPCPQCHGQGWIAKDLLETSPLRWKRCPSCGFKGEVTDNDLLHISSGFVWNKKDDKR